MAYEAPPTGDGWCSRANAPQQQLVEPPQQRAQPAPAPPSKKRGRPAGSLDKVKRNPKGAGLAKQAAYKTSGRPSKAQREARIAHMRLQQEIKQIEETDVVAPSHKYAELVELAEKAGLKEPK
ncbi:hypothetical protein SLS60_008616 [Paraconiothyrium brasiliense]|uniref:Uncharacterized protein n=1 Tax=Paraconiothyrium brasiliense TaxID=300254 RepID=A0ABR3QXZ9_9PLEO